MKKLTLKNVKNIIKEKKFKYPKILHLYWDGSPLSFLNYLTVLSFNKYHEFWEIIIYRPTKKTDSMSWTGSEQKMKYNERCYFQELNYIKNVTFQKVNLNEIGFYNDASEVIKSDYFRYYILHKYGGLWSDFDIIYTSCIEKKMNFSEDSVIFRCKLGEYYYYPIGLLLSVPNTKIFKYILDQCKNNYDSSRYQSIGATMWRALFPNIKSVYNIDLSVKFCNEDYYLPWAWNQLDEFLVKKENSLPDNNVGIHWFNGAEQSKKYSIDLDKKLDNFKIECYLDKFVKEYLEFYNKKKSVKSYVKNTEKVSILFPVYNKSKDLYRSLDSVINQTYINWEIIIIEDCSIDDSLYVIEKYISEHRDKNIRLYKNEKNLGVYVSLNKGLQKSKGEYICRLDADDILDISCLEKCVNILKTPNIYVVHYKYVREKDFSNYGEIGLFYRKNIIDKIGYYDSVRFAADTEFKERVYLSFINNIYQLDEVLYYASHRENSLTTSKEIGVYTREGLYIRLKYMENARNWHKQNVLYISYPLNERPFEAPLSMI